MSVYRLVFNCCSSARTRHSFPTRRSSDLSNDRKCLVRSCDSSIRIPKRSSMAIESSMKSSESRPIEPSTPFGRRSEEHTSELQSHSDLVCRLVLEKKKDKEEPAGILRCPL